MAKVSRKRQLRGEHTRTSLIRAARQLVSEKGFEGASVKEVTKRVGASVGSFYHHFKSKEDLLAQALDEESLAIRRYLREIRTLSSGVSFEDRIREACKALVTFAEENRSIYMLFFLQSESLPPGAREIVEEDRRRYHGEMMRDFDSMVASGLLEPFDVKLGSEAVYGALNQLLAVYFREPGTDRDAVIDAMVRTTVGTLRAMAGSKEPAFGTPDETHQGGKP